MKKYILHLSTCLIFFIFNPFLCITALAIFNTKIKIPRLPFIFFASLSFALFFYNREYGIYWYADSIDDVYVYISMFQSNEGLGFFEIFIRFFNSPFSNEPLWHLPWWFGLNFLNMNENQFIFSHYLLIFILLFYTFSMLSKRYFVILIFVYFFLSVISLDSIAHIWRQQIAFTIFLLGISLYFADKKKLGKLLVISTTFIHLSSLIFCFIFFITIFCIRKGLFNNKLKATLFLLLSLPLSTLMSYLIIYFLDSIGLSRVLFYFLDGDINLIRIYLLIGVYAVPQILSFYFLKNDDLNKVLLMVCFSVFSIIVAFPGASSFYGRLLMYILPIWAIYFYRIFYFNFNPIYRSPWHIAIIFTIFSIGFYRIYNPTLNDYGVMSFLAYGGAFDPLMGLLKITALL